MNQNKNDSRLYSVILAALCVCMVAVLIVLSIPADFAFSPNKNKTTPVNPSMKIISFIAPKRSSYPWDLVKQGFSDAARYYGFYANWINEDDMSDSLTSAILSKSDTVIFNERLLKNIQSQDTALVESGIPLLTIEGDNDSIEKRISNIRVDSIYTNAKIVSALKASQAQCGNIGLMINSSDFGNERDYVDSIAESLKGINQYSTIVSIEDTDIVEKLTTILTRKVDIDTLIILDESQNNECAKYLKGIEATSKTIILITDNTEQNIDLAKSGAINILVSPDYYRLGYIAGEFAHQYLKGDVIPNEHDIMSKIYASEL